jgi:hypothetical protein
MCTRNYTALLATTVVLLGPLPARSQDTNTEAALSNANTQATATAAHAAQIHKAPRAPIAPGSPANLPPEVLAKMTPREILELNMASHRPKAPDINDIVFLVTFPSFGFLIILTIMLARVRRNRVLHETIRMMIDKGAPIPPELLQPQTPKRNDLRSGILLIGTGLGLAIVLAGRGGHVYLLGFLPIFIGLAFLVTWKLEGKNKA